MIRLLYKYSLLTSCQQKTTQHKTTHTLDELHHATILEIYVNIVDILTKKMMKTIKQIFELFLNLKTLIKYLKEINK